MTRNEPAADASSAQAGSGGTASARVGNSKASVRHMERSQKQPAKNETQPQNIRGHVAIQRATRSTRRWRSPSPDLPTAGATRLTVIHDITGLPGGGQT